jgi:hypothetical protein
MNEIQALSARIEHLERECRTSKRWRNVLILAVIGITAIAARSPETQAAVVTRSLRVVDAKGLTVAELGSDPDTPRATSLCLYDRAQDGRTVLAARLKAEDGGGAFDLTGDENHGAIWMMALKNRSADIGLFTSCTDPSHGRPDGCKVGVADLRGSPEGGSTWLSTFESANTEGEHKHLGRVFFRRDSETPK